MGKTEKRLQKGMGILGIGLAGAIISMALSAMLITGSFSPEAFYDAGFVREERYVSTVGCIYDYMEGNIDATEAGAYQVWNFPDTLKKYNYFIIKIEGLGPDGMQVDFQFYTNGVLADTQNVNLKNGENVIEVRQNEANALYMLLPQGVSYENPGIECREKLSAWDTNKFIIYSLLAGIVYFVIFFTIQKLLKNRKRCKFTLCGILGKFQKVYRKIVQQHIQVFPLIGKTKVRLSRRLLFFFMISVANSTEKKGLSVEPEIWNRNVWIYCVILIVIAFLSIEKAYRKLNWNHPLASVWFLFSLCMIISDFIVAKRFRHIGIIFLTIFGFFYYVWGNMEDKTELTQDICAAVKLEFWLDIGYCFLFCPEIPGIRYTGSYLNSNVYAIYMVVPWTVFFTEMLENAHVGRKFTGRLSAALGVGIATCMIWKTESRTYILGTLFAITAAILFCKREKVFQGKKEKGILLCLLAAALLGGAVGQAGVTVLPKLPRGEGQEVPVAYGLENETSLFRTEQKGNGSIVKEASPMNHLVEKFFYSKTLNDFTSGRITFWKAYVRQMNFWGHHYRAYVNDRKLAAHNVFLSIAYEYGALSALAYLFWIIYYIWFSLKYRKRETGKSQYAALPLFLIINMLPSMLFENLEQPFRWEAWLVMYLLAGLLFGRRAEGKLIPANSK